MYARGVVSFSFFLSNDLKMCEPFAYQVTITIVNLRVYYSTHGISTSDTKSVPSVFLSLSLSLSLSLFVRYPFSSLNLRLATEVRLVFRLFARDRVNGTTERRSDAAKHRLSQVAEKKETKQKKKKEKKERKKKRKLPKVRTITV